MGYTEKVSPKPGDEGGPDKTSLGEVMNVEMDRDHYAKLLILAELWRADSPDRFIEKYIEDTWQQLGEFIPMDLTLQDFREVARSLLELEG